MDDFSGKTIFITGAGNGIGRATAVAFARAKANIILTDIDKDSISLLAKQIVQEFKTKCLAVQMDVTNKEQVDSAVAKGMQEFVTIDVLVNNAGIVQKGSFEEITWDDWKKILDINVGGAVLCTQAVIEHMKAKRFGKIINISSIGGEVGAVVAAASYAASKAALIGLTKSLAKVYAPYNININAVAPGPVKTKLAKNLGHEVKMVPLGRLGEPEDIAEVIVFLASEKASFITGATIDVNGGMFMK
jgi:3-oxoacyl-[acyl-carrier protein] reductase